MKLLQNNQQYSLISVNQKEKQQTIKNNATCHEIRKLLTRVIVLPFEAGIIEALFGRRLPRRKSFLAGHNFFLEFYLKINQI
jgi:hypothetical protein